MAQYQSKKRPGVLYLEDGRSFAYNDLFYAGEQGFDALSGSDLTHLQTGVIVLVAGDPGEPVRSTVRLNVDPETTEVWPADADPNTDDPIVALNSVENRAGLPFEITSTNADGDPTQIDYADGSSETITYRTDGQPDTRTFTPSGGDPTVLTYAYDSVGNITGAE